MLKIISSVIVVLALGSLAQADHHEKGEGPCKKDVETLCAGIEPGEGRIMKCLKENDSKVSAECKAKKDMMKKHFKEIKEACHEDAEKFCSDVKQGKGRIMKCMKKHKAELSESCKKEIDEAKAAKKGK